MNDCFKLKEVGVIHGQVVLKILKQWNMTWAWQRCKVSADAKASASSNPWTYNFIFCTGLAGGASQQTNKNTHMKIHIAFMIGRDSGSKCRNAPSRFGVRCSGTKGLCLFALFAILIYVLDRNDFVFMCLGMELFANPGLFGIGNFI